MSHRLLPLLIVLACPVVLLTTGCDTHCVGDECDEIPDIPWDPGTDTGDDGYGYDTDTDTDDSGDTGEPPIVIVAVRDCDVVLRHEAPGGVSRVQVSGEFNDWTPQDLAGPGQDGLSYVDLGELEPGEYAYKFVYDGSYEGQPPENVYTKWLGGSENRDLRVGNCMLPLLQTVSARATSGGRLTATVQFASAADEVAIDPDAVRVTVGDAEVTAGIDVEEGTITVDVSDLEAGKHSLRVWASDEDGRATENEPLFVPLWVEDESFSWEDGLMYFAFTDRFRNGDWGEDDGFDPVTGVAECANYQGGDFKGVIDALDEGYFSDLGVNTIWLSPVYENPDDGYIGSDGTHYYSGYHGYWPIEPDLVEERFGDVADGSYTSGEDRLKELIANAHAQGIRVLFDLVLNHVHEDHLYVSEHPEWFGAGCVCGTTDCDWNTHAIDCWFMPYLPDLDYKNHEILMRVVDDTLALIEEYDIDAVRIDAAKHMDHVIMRTLRHRLQDDFESGGGAEFYLVGETFTGDRGLIMDYVGDHELSGQYDFPLYYSIRSTFISNGSFSGLDSAVAAGEAAYGDNIMSPFLGNHDVQRFATEYDGQAGDPWSGSTVDPMASGGDTVDQWPLINRMSMAFAFTLTQRGIPLVYYGDEIGLHGGGDPDNRRIMNFDPYLSANQEALLARVQAIGQARAGSNALRRGERVQLWVDGDLYVYARDAGGGEVAIVAMNKSSGSRSESVDVSALGIDGETLTDALGSGESTSVSGGRMTVSLDSWQYVIFEPRDHP